MASEARCRSRAVALALTCVACASADVPQGALRFERATHRVAGGAPAALLVTDVDGDGAPDLVASSGDVQVLLGDGRGGFRSMEPVPAGENPAGLAAGDFDGDGRVDLAVANHETDGVTVLLNDGAGRFRPAPGSPLRPGFAPHPHAVAAGDVDGDGAADLLVDDRSGHAVLVLPGLGDGRFGPPRSVPVGGDPYRDPWLGDLDGDGDLDLVTPNERALAVLLGDGAGGFAAAPESPVAAPDPFGATAADVNGDGVADLASAPGEGGDGVTVLLGLPGGGYAPAPGSPVAGVRGPARIVSGDLDGDGFDDLVAGGWPGSSLLIVLGGAGGLTSMTVDAGRNPWSPVVADLDGDGRLDIAVANEGDGTVTVLLGRLP